MKEMEDNLKNSFTSTLRYPYQNKTIVKEIDTNRTKRTTRSLDTVHEPDIEESVDDPYEGMSVLRKFKKKILNREEEDEYWSTIFDNKMRLLHVPKKDKGKKKEEMVEIPYHEHEDQAIKLNRIREKKKQEAIEFKVRNTKNQYKKFMSPQFVLESFTKS